MSRSLSLILGMLLAGLGACRGAVYVLPDPVAPELTRDVSTDPAEERTRDAERYLEARQTILGLYDALANGRWDEAAELVSSETAVLLSEGGQTSAGETLASGTLTLGGAATSSTLWALAPAGFARWMTLRQRASTRVRPAKGRPPHLEEGRRSVVVIREGDAWRLHIPTLPEGRVESARDVGFARRARGRGDRAARTVAFEDVVERPFVFSPSPGRSLS